MGEVPCADIKERIMGDLVQGKTMANQLQALLQDPCNYGSDLVHDLVAKILGYFSESLSVLASRHPSEGGNKKRSGTSKEEKRGCYKRRKSCQSRTTVASTIEDDHTWRKYGQKEILNSNYPRSYFRCKFYQNCKAIRQVQKMEENPRMYEITNIGVHTCTDGRKAPPPPPPPPPQMTMDSASSWDIQSFDAISCSNSLDIKDDLLFNCSSTSATLPLKEEAKSDLSDIEIDSLLMGDCDLPAEGSSKYQGYGMDFLMDDESSNLSMFGY